MTFLERLLGPTHPKPKPNPEAESDAPDRPWDDREVDQEYPLPHEGREESVAHQYGETGGPTDEPWSDDNSLRWQDQLPATEESAAVRRDVFDERQVIALPSPGSRTLDTIPHPIASAEHTPLHHDGIIIRGTLIGEAEQFPLTVGDPPRRILGRVWTRNTATIVNQGTVDAWVGFSESMSATSASFKIPAGGALTTQCVAPMFAVAIAAGAVLHVIQEHNG